jgi:K+-transporting ATPase KdpF subunit
MSLLYWICLGLSVAIGVYLFYALLKAEDF